MSLAGSNADAAVECAATPSGFAAELGARMVARLQVACHLGIVLIPAFFLLDFLVHPQLVGILFRLRVAMVAFLVLTLLALRTTAGRRHVVLLSFLVIWQTGLGVIVMTALDGGAASGYYAGVNLVMLAAAVLLPWDAMVSVLTALTLILSYVVACAVWGGIPDSAIFAQNLFFLGSTGLIMVVSNHTARKSAEREFAQRVALEDAGRHRDHFLANITHELRTPLAAILGFTEMLVDYMEGATAEQLGWLNRIRDNALTLYRLIVQILDFSKIEAGALELARHPLDLVAIVDKVATDMRAIASGTGNEVAVAAASQLPVVMGDADRVEEIVSNLAANALKFSGGRPIHLGIRTATLERSPGWQRVVPDPGPEAVGRRYVEITVVDTGVGIAPEGLRRLFVAFLQLDGSTNRRHEGTGLGLAISSRLAATMQGHIAVHSKPGVGSTFALLLPIEEGAGAQRSEPATSDAPPLASLSA